MDTTEEQARMLAELDLGEMEPQVEPTNTELVEHINSNIKRLSEDKRLGPEARQDLEAISVFAWWLAKRANDSAQELVNLKAGITRLLDQA